jgi:hypothetical protein
MSQLTFPMPNNQQLVCGWDEPFHTYFLQVWNLPAHRNPSCGWRDHWDDNPVYAAGYHPAEEALDPRPLYGPFPLDLDELERQLEGVGIDSELRQHVIERCAADRK